MLRLIRNPYTNLLANLIYALGNCCVGLFTHSWWFITVGAYFAVLSATRFSVLRIKRKAGGDLKVEFSINRIAGILLVVLSTCIAGVNLLSAVKERGTALHQIIIIAIATWTFAKITMAIIGMAKVRRVTSPALKALRNISLADACVSVCTMQRSMLQSFPGMEPMEIQILNIFTGTAAWLIVLLLGVHLIGGTHTNMAKSKIVRVIDKTSETVTGVYKKIETGAVKGSQAITQGIVRGYTKIEDKFVDAFLTKDGETVEEAKARLKKGE